MRVLSIPVLGGLLLAPALAAEAAAVAAPPHCYGEGKGQTCALSFGDLWGSQERYAGRRIEISGYLVRGFGQLVLYPGKDYFLYQKGIGGIAVQMDQATLEAAFAEMRPIPGDGDWKYEALCPITVQGIYSDKPFGDLATLGTVTVASGPRMLPFIGSCADLPPKRPQP
ncbi:MULTISPECIES: hypothetical protein [Stenotrophomonas]|uniref:hypothetical protein n=1 Tax=Stenotrophomonas TaxID=40323 RepID=UPI000872E509|nr:MULTISPECIES: hypothetical protein [Stenotrophomonas]OEZ02023.1 hypothetical protein BIY45_03520 [Stenotrophomonas sp. BIIR7]